MPLAVDSSALWSVIKGEEMSEVWLRFITSAARRTHLVVCDVVVAETAVFFDDIQTLLQRLNIIGIEYEPINPKTAFMAGEIFSQYRRAGGPRTSLVPDFLIGAHALNQAGGLLTSDRGYLRRYFKNLKILEPARRD
jgi:predicted nucleic acid-binding protein